jgi:hypothetical protein
VTINYLIGECVGEVVTERAVVCSDFAKVGTDARNAAETEFNRNGCKCVAVDVVSIGGVTMHVSLNCNNYSIMIMKCGESWHILDANYRHGVW